jgi:sulfotransferase
MKSEVPVERRKNMVRHLFEGYYQDVDKEVIFNTNRAWTLLTGVTRDLYPKSKHIVCVRDLNWVLDSFESAHRRNPFSTNTVTGGHSGTVYSRTDELMGEKGVVGFPYIGVKQAITGPDKDLLFIVEYEELCKNPKDIIRALYNFIDEPQFEHDFNNVEASWDEYDSEIGIKLHEIFATQNTFISFNNNNTNNKKFPVVWDRQIKLAICSFEITVFKRHQLG